MDKPHQAYLQAIMACIPLSPINSCFVEKFRAVSHTESSWSFLPVLLIYVSSLIFYSTNDWPCLNLIVLAIFKIIYLSYLRLLKFDSGLSLGKQLIPQLVKALLLKVQSQVDAPECTIFNFIPYIDICTFHNYQDLIETET